MKKLENYEQILIPIYRQGYWDYKGLTKNLMPLTQSEKARGEPSLGWLQS